MGRILPIGLSGSDAGRQIKVAATSTPGTAIHTAVLEQQGGWDEIWLWATNSDSAARKLTIEWGGTSSPDDLIEVNLVSEGGQVWIVRGGRLSNGRVVRAFASSANVVMVGGYVNRILPDGTTRTTTL